MKHTPTDWKAHDSMEGFSIYGSGFRLAVMRGGEVQRDKANAQFIVKAVNNHDKLVEALGQAADYMAFLVNHADLEGAYERTEREIKEAREVLEQVEAS